MSDAKTAAIARLSFAIKKKKNDEVIEILEKYGTDLRDKTGSALSIACITENWDIARYCMEHGANVNDRDAEQGTPLLNACKYGNFEIVKRLVEAGAEINAANKFDKRPIAMAIGHQSDNLEMIEYLLKHGANPFIEEKYGKDNPKRETFTAYDFAKKELKNKSLVSLLDQYRGKK